MRAAAEAIIKLFWLADGKRSAFFIMEGATGKIIAAGFLFQWNMGVDKVNNVDFSEHEVDEFSGDVRCHTYRFSGNEWQL